MKLFKIFHLEFTYQLRRIAPWLYFAVVFGISFLSITSNYIDDARDGYFLINAPVVIASVTVVCCFFWVLIGASVAGEAAARDVQTRMFSLTYISPTSKTEYLGGRFLAALLLNALILLAIPAGLLMAIYVPEVEAELLGPFRPAAYLSTYFFIVLPNAFFATAIQFALAALSRRAMAGYVGGSILFAAAYTAGQVLDGGQRSLGILVDPLYFNPVLDYLNEWSPIERNTRLIELDGPFLANRFLWIFIGMCMLSVTGFRFRFAIPSTGSLWKKKFSPPASVTESGWLKWRKTEPLPQTQGNFSFAAQMVQLRFITIKSFWALAKKPSGLLLVGLIALIAGLAMPGNLKAKGVPLIPRTDQILQILSAPITAPRKFWIMIFLLSVFYAGELVWRERESRLSELFNATPVPEWVFFLSEFLTLSLMFIAGLVFMLIAGVIAQIVMGGADIKLGLYIKALFGFQLIECLLFAMLALVVHIVVNQKYLGHLVAFMVFGSLIFASNLGLEHKLLIFGASPEWSYTNMGGFGLSVEPWLWFKAYWVAWALLLAVGGRLLWVRSREESLMMRLQLARRRFTRTTTLTIAVAVGLIVISGSFIFYNTNILNQYSTASEKMAAAYEQRYGKYSNVPQPLLAHVNLVVEMYPEQQELEVKGTYMMVNPHSVPIDSVHLAIPAGVETKGIVFNRLASPVLEDHQTGFLIYALRKPLEPGDTLQLDFKVHYKAEGFTNNGAGSDITPNFTKFRNYEWLPAIGYQPYRELDDVGNRKKYGLTSRPATASLYNVKARNYAPFAEHITFNAVVGTHEGQMVVAPGTLHKTWRNGNRHYFHYATDVPIRNEYSFFSAKYALHESLWTPAQNSEEPVTIQIYYDPGNTENLERMVKSVKASLSYYTTQFGPYLHRQLRFLAIPGYSGGNHAAPINITAEEGFFLLNPKQDPRGFDLVTAVVAHEVAHQWWGNQLKSANVEGAGLLSESLAWYSAMGVMEENYGPEYLNKLLSFLREEYENPRTKAALPLLQSTDFYHYYRKGPFVLYALSEYIGRERVNKALSSLLQKHKPGKTPMATSLDLYQELQSVAPDSLQYLLHDFFEKNIFWDLETKGVTAKKTKSGSWQVTLNLQSHKLAVDSAGVETELPINTWIEIGVYASAEEEGKEMGKPMYLQKHYINSTRQTITVTVPQKPASAGIDPNHLLIDWEVNDNIKDVKSGN